MAKKWFERFAVTFFVVKNEIFLITFLLMCYDFRKLINFIFLIFRRVGIIKKHCLREIYLQKKLSNRETC